MKPNAIDLATASVKKWEGCELKSYPDPGTGDAPYTIGWGSTGNDIKPGTSWTQTQADNRLHQDIANLASRIDAIVAVSLSSYQLAALISLANNIGFGALSKSTLVRLLNKGDYEGAAQQFARWNRAAGRVMQGLTNRRSAEAELFRGII